MKTFLTAAALVLAAIVPAAAQTVTPASNVEGSTTKTSALYVALGEKAGITALMNDFVDHLREDPQIGEMFRQVKPAYLKTQLSDQICMVAGGPCAYEGETMKKSHADLKIDRQRFNVLVEVLQASMRRQNIPFSTQNQLLAVLAPMHRDIITVH